MPSIGALQLQPKVRLRPDLKGSDSRHVAQIRIQYPKRGFKDCSGHCSIHGGDNSRDAEVLTFLILRAA